VDGGERQVESALSAPQAVAKLAYDRRGQLDAVVLCGDLADDGERENLESARLFIEEAPAHKYLSSDGFPTLGWSVNANVRILLLPGNHDRFRGEMRLPGGVQFDSVFGSYWRSGLNGIHAATISKGKEKLILAFADFCMPNLKKGRSCIWGQGLAGRGTVDGLESLTIRLREEAPMSAIIWILHFPPLIDVEKKLRLRRAQRVLDAAIRTGVRKIFAGHLHRDQDTPYSEVQVICTASAASEYRPLYGTRRGWLKSPLRETHIP
jgi:3',5'-cyclic AMP phosphodiesterase CpdA